MPKKREDERFLQLVVKTPVHAMLKYKAAMARMTMTEFIISAVENYTPDKTNGK